MWEAFAETDKIKKVIIASKKRFIDRIVQVLDSYFQQKFLQDLIALIFFFQHTHMPRILQDINVRFFGKMALLQAVFKRYSVIVFSHDK